MLVLEVLVAAVAGIEVQNYKTQDGRAFLQVSGVTCGEDALYPQINLGSISIPGMSKLAYGGADAEFMEPASSGGVDPEWARDHPYLLGGKFDEASAFTPDATFLEDSGLFVPEVDPPRPDEDNCRGGTCLPHRETFGFDDSHLVFYQRARMLNQTPPDLPRSFKYGITGAVDLRRDAKVNADLAGSLARLTLNNGARDGSTIDLAEASANYSFNGLYERAARDFPGLLPAWSPHSPFVDPYAARDPVLSSKAYRAGAPFYRYNVKPCPGKPSACCIGLESAMKIGASDCGTGPFCGRNNPVASAVRPGNPPVELFTDTDSTAADVRLSWKIAGIHTAFARSVPDIGSIATPGQDTGCGFPDEVCAFISYLGKIKSDKNQQIKASTKSPKCGFISPEGAGSRYAVLFLEHFYVSLNGEFQDIREAQRSRQRPWKEGETEYVAPRDADPAMPRYSRHVLDASKETPDDPPPSERLAFVFGPKDLTRPGTTAMFGGFNDADSPCSQVDFTTSSRSAGTSAERIGMAEGETTINNTRCACRRVGKYEWMLQALLATYMGSEWRSETSYSVCAAVSDLQTKERYDGLIGQPARTLFWDIDNVFQMTGYTTARSGETYARLARLHTTAPVGSSDPVQYANYRNVYGLPGGDRIVPTLDADACAALADPPEGVCDVCKLAANYQMSATAHDLRVGTCLGDPDFETDPDTTTSSPYGNPNPFYHLPDCCKDGVPLDVSSDLIWKALKISAGADFPEHPEAEFPGTGARWLVGDAGPAAGGTSDGTPRTNVYAASCHVDPEVNTEFLIGKVGKIDLGSGIPDAVTGFSTFTAGTLWPGSSFRPEGPAEPFSSLGCATDRCTADDSGGEVDFYQYKTGSKRLSDQVFSIFGKINLNDEQDTGKTFVYPLKGADRSESVSAATEHRYGIHTCADQDNRTYYTVFDFGGRGVLDGASRPPSCTCCAPDGPYKLDTAPAVSQVGVEHWDLRWSFYRGSDGRSKNPAFAVDVNNNVRYYDDESPPGGLQSDYEFYKATRCCQPTPLCACEPDSHYNGAGEPCTSVGSYQTLTAEMENDVNELRRPQDYWWLQETYTGAKNPWTTRRRCHAFRDERGDGSIVVGARASRGGYAPATPPSTFGGIRVPPIQQLFNNDTCVDWRVCGTGTSGSKECDPNDNPDDRKTYGRLGASAVGTQTADAGDWHAVNPTAASIGVLKADRCFTGIEKLGHLIGPLCVHLDGFQEITPEPGVGIYEYPNEFLPAGCNPTLQDSETQTLEDKSTLRLEYRPPFVHPSRSKPTTTAENCIDRTGSSRTKLVRGLDGFSDLFEDDPDQKQVGRVSWGPRTQDGSELDGVQVPAPQDDYRTTEPYLNGKNDGLLECSGGDQASLSRELLRHSLLKSADICVPEPGTVGDDGISVDEHRSAFYRDTYSSCVNPADAAAPFCAGLVVEGGEAAAECVRLFGNGRSLRPQNPTDWAYLEEDDPGGRGPFPRSCSCTGDAADAFPFESTDTEKAGWLSTLCVCGSVARTSRVVVGSPEAPGNEDYENPPFLDDSGVESFPFCSCPTDAPCGIRTRCGADRVGVEPGPFSGFPGKVDGATLAAAKAKYGSFLDFETIPPSFLSRRAIQFEDADKKPVNAETPFTADELLRLTTCLSSGTNCAQSQQSYGPAVLTYPAGTSQRLIILAPNEDGTCPSLSAGAGSLVETYVTGSGAPFSELAPLFQPATTLALAPVPYATIGGSVPIPEYRPVGESANPVAGYLQKTSGFLPPDIGVGAGPTHAGCILGASSAPAELGALLGHPVSLGDGPLGGGSFPRPLLVGDDFVFGDDGKAVETFQLLAADCVRVAALLMAGPTAALNEDAIVAEVRTSLCLAAADGATVLPDPGEKLEVSVILPHEGSFGAIGSCRTVGDAERLFTVPAVPGTVPTGATVVFPADCYADILFELLELDGTFLPSGPPVTVAGTLEQIDPAVCGAGSIRFAAAVPRPVPYVAPAGTNFDETSFAFPAVQRNFPDGTPYREPALGSPCWTDVCNDFVEGDVRVVISAAGRAQQETRFFAEQSDSFPPGCLPEGTVGDDDVLDGGNCAMYRLGDANRIEACGRFPVNITAPLSSWNSPGAPPSPRLVAEAPLISTCRSAVVRRLDGFLSAAATLGTARVPPTVVYGGAGCGLTVRVTVFSRVSFGYGRAPVAGVLTAAGISGSSSVVIFPEESVPPAVVPVLQIPRPPEAPVGTVSSQFFALGLVDPEHQPAGTAAPGSCTPFLVPAGTAPVPGWEGCLSSLRDFAVAVPTGADTGAVVITPEGAPVLHYDPAAPGPICGGSTKIRIIAGLYPVPETEPPLDIVVLPRAGAVESGTKCIDRCAGTKGCFSLYFNPVSHRCVLLSGAARVVAFEGGTLPVSVAGPGSTPFMAFCPAAAAETLAPSAGPLQEPCGPGTVETVGASGEAFCGWTPCDPDTEYAIPNPALERVHGECPPNNVEAAIPGTLVKIARGSETVWEAGADVPVEPIDADTSSSVKFTYTGEWRRPDGAAAVSPGSVGTYIDSVDISGSAPLGVAYNRYWCDSDGSAVENPAVGLFPGHKVLGGTFDPDLEGCRCPSADDDVDVP